MADNTQPKRGRKLLTALAVAAVLIALLVITSRITYPKNNSYEAGEIEAWGAAINAEPENTIDALIVGDSEVLDGYRPLLMWDDRGFTTYDLTFPGMRLHAAKAFLERAFKTQKPKVVAIETNMLYSYFSFGDAFKAELENIFPVLKYHDRWKKLTADDFTKEPEAKWVNLYRGFRPEHGIVTADDEGYMEETEQLEETSPINKAYLSYLINYIREQGATPILISTPSTVNWSTSRHNFVADWAAKNGVDYYDFNAEPNKVDIDWEKESRDGGDHLNMDGSKKLSHYVAQLLDDTYDLPDHRGDNDYLSWTVDLTR